MHVIISFAAIVGLVWFAYGERAARIAAGVGLGTAAVLALVGVSTMLYVVHRDNAKWQRTATVTYGYGVTR